MNCLDCDQTLDQGRCGHCLLDEIREYLDPTRDELERLYHILEEEVST